MFWTCTCAQSFTDLTLFPKNFDHVCMILVSAWGFWVCFFRPFLLHVEAACVLVWSRKFLPSMCVSFRYKFFYSQKWEASHQAVYLCHVHCFSSIFSLLFLFMSHLVVKTFCSSWYCFGNSVTSTACRFKYIYTYTSLTLGLLAILPTDNDFNCASLLWCVWECVHACLLIFLSVYCQFWSEFWLYSGSRINKLTRWRGKCVVLVLYCSVFLVFVRNILTVFIFSVFKEGEDWSWPCEQLIEVID